VPSIYPQGFTPRITSIIEDNSLSAGIRTTIADGWAVDFNNTVGENDFHYFIMGTNNATLGDASPTDFDAGGHVLTQNTTSLDFSRYFETTGETGFNLAFGMEYRTDNFEIFAGELGSYAAFDVNGLEITGPDQESTGLAAGSQGFPGYSPANEVDRSRSNFALYADTEFDISSAFLVSAALRYENYTDFGSTLNWKIASRVKAGDRVSLYNLRFTGFQDGVLTETLLSANNSPVTQGFGIEALKEDDIDDRIVISGFFDAGFLGIGVEGAQFFANAADTESLGLDVVLSYKIDLVNQSNLSFTLAGNLNDLDVTNISNGNLDQETFFGPREQSLLEDAAPSSKFAFNATYTAPKFNASVALTRFGEVSYLSFDNATRVNYESKFTTDVTVTARLSENINFTLGSNNLFNVYPTQQIASDNTDSGGFWDSVQMGFGGAYYFARVGFSF